MHRKYLSQKGEAGASSDSHPCYEHLLWSSTVLDAEIEAEVDSPHLTEFPAQEKETHIHQHIGHSSFGSDRQGQKVIRKVKAGRGSSVVTGLMKEHCH